jgi:isopentenyl diphosphate isomerase/L-lactate dehydrogenase-like FMN-dependent dehydrogenase
MWGLAAYGADGVQGIVEMLQTELARYMAMCGRTDVKMLDRTMLRLHGATSPGKPATGSTAGASHHPSNGVVRG